MDGVRAAAAVTRARPHWLLFDGDCDFCGRCAAWIRRRDREGRLSVVAYQKAPAPPMTPALRLACAEALHLVTAGGRSYRGGDACIALLAALGRPRFARFLAAAPLRRAIGLGYGLVAANRARL